MRAALGLAFAVAGCSAADGATRYVLDGGSGAGGDDGGGGGEGGGGGAGGAEVEAGELVSGLAVTEVAVYQTVKIALMKDRVAVSANAPVVEGKAALLRAFVTPREGWQARPVVGELTLVTNGERVVLQSNVLRVTAASTDSNLTSSLNFTLTGASLTPDTHYRVEIREAEAGAPGGDGSEASWPPSGEQPLGARSARGPLRVEVVPFLYKGDGSGRAPDSSPAQLERYRKAFLAVYPAAEVEITAHAPVTYNATIGADGSGWESWLDTLCSLRTRERPDPRVYYWGIMAPTSASFWNGVAGLGNVPDADGNWGRCAVGLGMAGVDTSGQIAIHEIGHTHGRLHAPCQVPDADRRYPYPNARLGSWGYDLALGRLKAPTSFYDFMSYCEDQWVSDYTYAGLFERLVTVNASQFRLGERAATSYQKVLVGLDGRVSNGGRITLDEPLRGEPRAVDTYDRAGASAGTVTGHYYPFSHGGGVLFVPEPRESTRFLEPRGLRRVDLLLEPAPAHAF